MKANETKLGEVCDLETQKLILELARLRRIDAGGMSDISIREFLFLSLHHFGKIVRFEKKEIDQHDLLDEFILAKKVGKVGVELQRLLAQLCYNHGFESFLGSTVFTLLNRTLAPPQKKGR
jgi:hypothetical protein